MYVCMYVCMNVCVYTCRDFTYIDTYIKGNPNPSSDKSLFSACKITTQVGLCRARNYKPHHTVDDINPALPKIRNIP